MPKNNHKPKNELEKVLEETSSSNKSNKSLGRLISTIARWIDNRLMPVAAAVIILVGAVDSALTRVKEIPKLPEMAQGAIVVVVLSYFVSRAYRLIRS